MENLTLEEAFAYMNENDCELKHEEEKERWSFSLRRDARIYGAESNDMLTAISKTKEYIKDTNVKEGKRAA